ncbi:MAG: LLM class flavin-dependent oxidoreductase, partial [Candidatus Heimdallarchaeota archaeon]|nr:LLM class flavin-dependent oxidoreductase [Candidatus Heimdallarchaeota archaeon]
MDLGIVLSSDYLPAHDLIKMAPLVDQLGYSQISVPEIWGHDAFSLISVLSQVTNKVELATGIVNIFSRTAATMAMTVASIDEMSRGRFTLGLGLSGPAVIENLHGMKFAKPMTRTKEYVEILRTLLNGKRLNHETSQLGNLRSFSISIKNIRKEIPIHIAALGPKNIELTANIADGWIPVIMPITAFKEEVEKVKSLVPADKSEFAITPFVLSIAGDEKEEMNLLRNHLAYYFGGMGTYYNSMLKRVGFEEEADIIMNLWKKGKIKEAVASVTDELL